MKGVDYIYAPPEQKLVARCGTSCGCVWVNLFFGWVRLPIPRKTNIGTWKWSYCWGWWLSKKWAGLCLRAVGSEEQEKPIGHVCRHTGQKTIYEK